MNVQTKICTHIENTQELIIENTQERTHLKYTKNAHWKYTRNAHQKYTGIDKWKCTRKELHQTLNSSSGHQFSSSTASAIHSRKREEAQSPKTRGKTANTNNKTESTQSPCVTWYRYKYNVAREVKSKCKMPCSWGPTQGGPKAHWPSEVQKHCTLHTQRRPNYKQDMMQGGQKNKQLQFQNAK